MNELLELKKDICASLYVIPCRLDELYARWFLKNRSKRFLDLFINDLIKNEWIYQKGNKYYCYKETVRKHLQGYELD